ncbi:thiopeptide-type bacteriocin biosynthesis protein [Streptomyces sp. NPDC046197]|uniref:thiopeptide-type bacteriocin biosynthesis protein n=1 Tax=Streptomyces sp. NPDC046197 TaxID=3154337 RepID=UPI0033E635AD
MSHGHEPLDPAAADGADWVCAHIFYDTDQDALLTGCVRPLVRELTDARVVQRWFFLRYWEGGPHVRLRLLPRHEDDRTLVEKRLLEQVRAFLARTPSADVVDRSRFAEVARGLAGLEGRSGHDQAVRPNNSVELLPYEREHGDYGYGPAVAAVERHFHESSELALSVVAAGTTVDQRALLAFDLVVGVFALCDEVREQWARHGGPPLPFGSGPEAPDVEERYRVQGPQLRRRALRAWQGTREGGDRGQRAYWAASVRRLREALHTLEDSGGFASQWADSPLAAPLNLAGTAHPATSLVLLRCAHLVNNRLGLTLWQENQLRFLVGRVLSDLPEAATAS